MIISSAQYGNMDARANHRAAPTKIKAPEATIALSPGAIELALFFSVCSRLVIRTHFWPKGLIGEAWAELTALFIKGSEAVYEVLKLCSTSRKLTGVAFILDACAQATGFLRSIVVWDLSATETVNRSRAWASTLLLETDVVVEVSETTLDSRGHVAHQVVPGFGVSRNGDRGQAEQSKREEAHVEK